MGSSFACFAGSLAALAGVETGGLWPTGVMAAEHVGGKLDPRIDPRTTLSPLPGDPALRCRCGLKQFWNRDKGTGPMMPLKEGQVEFPERSAVWKPPPHWVALKQRESAQAKGTDKAAGSGVRR